MNKETQQKLIEITNNFYAAQSESFSLTRLSAWLGWERCVETIKRECITGDSKASEPLRVLDVGCGNMRFEAYLNSVLSDRALRFDTVDNCAALIPCDLPVLSIDHHESDVISALVVGEAPWSLGANQVDVACCFGVFHHVPGFLPRLRLVQELVDAVHPGGLVILSLWRFMDIPALAEKAHETLLLALHDESLNATLRAQLFDLTHQNDYLLSWQNKPGVYRYCHSFVDKEVNELVEGIKASATVLDRFRSDGRSGDANEYLVLQKVS